MALKFSMIKSIPNSYVTPTRVQEKVCWGDCFATSISPLAGLWSWVVARSHFVINISSRRDLEQFLLQAGR